MQKYFNINGVCSPDRHYMVNIEDRLQQVKHLIAHGDYFVINRARQYGKTTILNALSKKIAEEYTVFFISFEGCGNAMFKNEDSFCRSLCGLLYDTIDYGEVSDIPQELQHDLYRMSHGECGELNLRSISNFISKLCRENTRQVVLIIDEVDQASNQELFLEFLGMLRDKFLKRMSRPAFQSVILAGVYDIKNLKLKLRDQAEHQYNSPWNIAAPFRVDMSFSPTDIQGMLEVYEQDHHTGMELECVANLLYEYSSGYPFLVSALCKKLDEEAYSWTTAGVRCAVRDFLKESNTLFDDVIKNIRNNQAFSNLVEQILLADAQVTFEISNPQIDLGVMYGILKEQDGKTVVSNMIFETLIFNYFISVRATRALTSAKYTSKELYVHDGRLDMEYVLQRFADFMKAEYRQEDGDFIERQGRLLFLSFLRPIINGTGHYAVEPQTRKNMRMDVQVFYGSEEFIVELKIWHGMKYEEKAYDQLVDYLEARGVQKGYLLSFCSNQSQPYEVREFQYRGRDIFEIVLMYN